MLNEKMQENELNRTAAHEYREEVGDFALIISMDAEGKVLYTRVEYPMCVEEIMVEMEE
jgi:tartrate dehydratase beta subunit/fumarate hydratase class I family protein